MRARDAVGRVAEPRSEWEIQNDVETLKRAEQIKRDTERMNAAKNYIKAQRAFEDTVLSTKTPPDLRHNNKATVMKLNRGF